MESCKADCDGVTVAQIAVLQVLGSIPTVEGRANELVRQSQKLTQHTYFENMANVDNRIILIILLVMCVYGVLRMIADIVQFVRWLLR